MLPNVMLGVFNKQLTIMATVMSWNNYLLAVFQSDCISACKRSFFTLRMCRIQKSFFIGVKALFTCTFLGC